MMKSLAFAIALLDCNSFEQADCRAYCRAVAQENSAGCYSIQDIDLRRQCRAELLNERSLCDSVNAPVKRAECRLRAGRL
jgi:hypothetical protein